MWSIRHSAAPCSARCSRRLLPRYLPSSRGRWRHPAARQAWSSEARPCAVRSQSPWGASGPPWSPLSRASDCARAALEDQDPLDDLVVGRRLRRLLRAHHVDRERQPQLAGRDLLSDRDVAKGHPTPMRVLPPSSLDPSPIPGRIHDLMPNTSGLLVRRFRVRFLATHVESPGQKPNSPLFHVPRA